MLLTINHNITIQGKRFLTVSIIPIKIQLCNIIFVKCYIHIGKDTLVEETIKV